MKITKTAEKKIICLLIALYLTLYAMLFTCVALFCCSPLHNDNYYYDDDILCVFFLSFFFSLLILTIYAGALSLGSANYFP